MLPYLEAHAAVSAKVAALAPTWRLRVNSVHARITLTLPGESTRYTPDSSPCPARRCRLASTEADGFGAPWKGSGGGREGVWRGSGGGLDAIQ
eukprot:7097016-Pyramimonas_sp.AAC.1